MKKTGIALRLVKLALFVSTATASADPVTFRLHAPLAQEVLVTGNFARWQEPRALKRGADGSWSLVVDLPPGRYEYLFLVDGRWALDPGAPALSDGLGGRNNIVIVPAAR